jgi:hypothetical protein
MPKPKSDARLRAEAMATAISNRAAARKESEARVATLFADIAASDEARRELGLS